MGTEVQFNMYISRYDDLNDKVGNKNTSLSYENSILRNTQNWTGLPRRSSINLPSGSEKEQMKQTMLKQETIFRHQLHELHRLYRIQKNLMNEAKSKRQSTFLSSSCISSQHDTNRCPNYYKSFSNRGGVHVSEKNVLESTSGLVKQNRYLQESKIQRQLFDLERPADEYINGEEDRSYSCLNGFPLKGEFEFKNANLFANPQTTIENGGGLHRKWLFNDVLKGKSASSSSSNNFFSQNSSFEIPSTSSHVAFSKIFGAEIPERNHAASSTITYWNNRSSGSSMVKPKNEELMQWQNGKVVPLRPMKQESSYQMSTDSLQKKFHQFVQDSSSSTRESKKNKCEDKIRSSLGNIGVCDRNLTVNSPKTGEVKAEEVASGPRNLFDLNVCLTEEKEQDEACLIQCQEKSMEINLEVPDTETEESESDKIAAEILIVLSSSKPDQHSLNGSLDWLANIISSLGHEFDSADTELESFAPEGMDYFEFMSLNLSESTENQPEKHKYKNISSPTRKGPTRWGRQRRDFQRDVLPGLTTLSRNEVTEDLHTIQGLLKAPNCRSKGPKSRIKRQCTSKGRDQGTLTLMQWGKRGRRPKRTRCSSSFHPVSPKEVF